MGIKVPLGPGLRHALATAVLVSTRCMYGGMPRRSTPASIMLQVLTPVRLSADMSPTFSSSVSRDTRSFTRSSMDFVGSQNGSACETLPGSQPKAWPLGR